MSDFRDGADKNFYQNPDEELGLVGAQEPYTDDDMGLNDGDIDYNNGTEEEEEEEEDA